MLVFEYHIDILVFGVIIFFHELGHFIVAKINHITVKEFSMGFGPKLFQFHKKETQYTLRLIPLGGYCMMLSEDDEENEMMRIPLRRNPSGQEWRLYLQDLP